MLESLYKELETAININFEKFDHSDENFLFRCESSWYPDKLMYIVKTSFNEILIVYFQHSELRRTAHNEIVPKTYYAYKCFCNVTGEEIALSKITHIAKLAYKFGE